MFVHVSKTALVFGVAGLLGACGSSASNGITDPLAPTAIAIVGRDPYLLMAPGNRVQLSVVARNASGQTVATTTPFRFLSRDTSVATVTDAGVVFSGHAGITQVVVQLDRPSQTLSDSIKVVVNPPNAVAGTGT